MGLPFDSRFTVQTQLIILPLGCGTFIALRRRLGCSLNQHSSCIETFSIAYAWGVFERPWHLAAASDVFSVNVSVHLRSLLAMPVCLQVKLQAHVRRSPSLALVLGSNARIGSGRLA